jgi:AcrR family transcriptional regulator
MTAVNSKRVARATKEDRQRALVLAAFDQVAEHGFEGLRTREVASSVGVNIATLHYYFPTKEALIRGVVAHAMDRFRSTLAPHGSADDQLVNHLKAVRALMRKEPELGMVMGELSLRSARDPSLARILRDTNDAWHQTIRALLRRAVSSGNLPRDFDTDEAAALIVATLTSVGLPTISATRKDQAVRELERWLKSATRVSRTRSSN